MALLLLCNCSYSPTPKLRGQEESAPVRVLSIPISNGCEPLHLTRREMFIRNRKVSLVQPDDVDQVLDMYIGQGRLEKDPYWCRIWPSAIALAEEILCHPSLVMDRCVCDLGAGLGLAGLAAAYSGAKRVVLLDQEPLALLCSLLSFQINFPGIATNLPRLLELYFPQTMLQDLDLFSTPSSMEVFGEVFDWTDAQLSLSNSDFDTVLACDLLYEKTAATYLAKIAPGLLSKHRPGATFLLADPVERTPRHRENFLELLQSSQLKLTSRSVRRPEMEGKLHQVELISFELRTSDSKK